MKLSPEKLFSLQILAHLFAIYWLFSGPSLIDVVVIFTVYFFTGCVGMSVTFHRLLTHRSFKASKWFEYFGTICATIGLTGSSITWTAAHRQHHAKADKSGDPHSPIILGTMRAQFLSMFSDVDVRKSPVLRDDFHKMVHRNYILINILWSLLLFIIGGFHLVLICHLVPAVLLWNSGSLINTICHNKYLGTRRYNVPDHSVNNPILGIFMWGEGWHNNHHRFQNRPNIGEKWWEIDVGYWVIKLVSTK